MGHLKWITSIHGVQYNTNNDLGLPLINAWFGILQCKYSSFQIWLFWFIILTSFWKVASIIWSWSGQIMKLSHEMWELFWNVEVNRQTKVRIEFLEVIDHEFQDFHPLGLHFPTTIIGWGGVKAYPPIGALTSHPYLPWYTITKSLTLI